MDDESDGINVHHSLRFILVPFPSAKYNLYGDKNLLLVDLSYCSSGQASTGVRYIDTAH